MLQSVFLLVFMLLAAPVASFVPVADVERAAAGSLARVTYERVDDQTLVLTVESKASSSDKPSEPALVFRMTRDSAR